MSTHKVTANGITKLTVLEKLSSSLECSVHVPADIGGASVSVGWIDLDGTFNAYVDGVLLAGESSRFAVGAGIQMAATITGYTTDFIILVGQ